MNNLKKLTSMKVQEESKQVSRCWKKLIVIFYKKNKNKNIFTKKCFLFFSLKKN